jgi:glycosyltransferase involved in cell wall biosynthesis
LGAATIILLATHNGARYLRDQIDSLQAQTVENWSVVARDDGSSDETALILDEYAAADSRIEILPPAASRLGSATRNFAGLLQAARERGAAYVLCCDQDDRWQPNKLERVLTRLREAENGGSIPCLVHHDLRVVDDRLEPIHPSYWAMMNLQPEGAARPQRLLSRNEVTGCALACNRALLEVALPVPDRAIMHDWWLALFAGFCGRLLPIPDTLVAYRQHGSNVIGAKSYRAGLNPLQNWLATWRRGDEEFLATVEQARAFRKRIEKRADLEPASLAALDLYCELTSLPRTQRTGAMRRCDAWRRQWLLDIVLALRLLLLRAP